MKKIIYFLLTIILICFFPLEKVMSQTNLFASMTGSPTVDTTGWNFYNNAVLGDTPGDANSANDEIVLTTAINNLQGQVFFRKPINLTTCTKWKVEFDMRIYNGNGADGIAFCMVDALPTTFFGAYGMGMPPTANGLKVCFDTYDNYVAGVQCGGNNPEIQIGYGPGYSECDASLTRLTNNTSVFTKNLSYLRDTYYDHITITYNNGTVTVLTHSLAGNPLHTDQTLTKTITPVNGNVWFGITAATGGLNDMHSIRNVQIFADVPATNNAGIDQVTCSGQAVQLGDTTTSNHTYTWTPATNLSSSTISNPTATIINSGTAPVDYTYTVKTERNGAASCYMVDTVKVTVNPAPALNESVSFCQGSSAIVHGQTVSTNGTHVYTLTSPTGCDTTLTVVATYLPTSSSTTNKTICSGNSYTFNGTAYDSTGTYSATLPNGGGCDSVATLNLVVNPPLTGSFSQAICSGSSFTYHGQAYNTAGTYPVNLTNPAGCDSIVSLTITLSPTIKDSVDNTICQGGSYTFNGNNYSTAGYYSDTLTSSGGCDSVATLHLVVNPPLTGSFSQAICSGSSFTYHGQAYNTAGTYPVNLTNLAGCDSIVSLTITISSTVRDSVNQTICQGGNYSFNGNNYSTAGYYSDSLTTSGGCDSIVTLHLLVNPPLTATINKTICAGKSVTYHGQTYNTSGTYTVNVSNPNTCDSVITLNIVTLPSPNQPTVNTNLPLECYGDNFQGTINSPDSTLNYIWTTDTTKGNGNVGNSWSVVVDESTPNIYVNSNNGTCSSAYIAIPITFGNKQVKTVQMPNVITPNNDGLNDEIDFSDVFGDCLDYNITLLNRWGKIVYTGKKGDAPFVGNDNKGNKLTEGTYFYKITYSKQKIDGFIQIIR